MINNEYNYLKRFSVLVHSYKYFIIHCSFISKLNNDDYTCYSKYSTQYKFLLNMYFQRAYSLNKDNSA